MHLLVGRTVFCCYADQENLMSSQWAEENPRGSHQVQEGLKETAVLPLTTSNFLLQDPPSQRFIQDLDLSKPLSTCKACSTSAANLCWELKQLCICFRWKNINNEGLFIVNPAHKSDIAFATCRSSERSPLEESNRRSPRDSLFRKKIRSHGDEDGDVNLNKTIRKPWQSAAGGTRLLLFALQSSAVSQWRRTLLVNHPVGLWRCLSVCVCN